MTETKEIENPTLDDLCKEHLLLKKKDVKIKKSLRYNKLLNVIKKQ